MSNPKVSIIIPFYNTEGYIEKCIKSLMEQTYAEIEMIFVNDGSTDKSRQIVVEYQKKDPRISLIDIKKSGVGFARNAGLAQTSGSYLMFCDSDDYYASSQVAMMVELMEEKADIDLAMCSCKLVNASASKRQDKKYLINRRDGIHDLTQYMKRQVNVFLWNKIFKMDLIRQYGIDCASLKAHEDENFIYKYLSVAKKINFTSARLYHYTYRHNSISESMQIDPTYIGDYLSCFENVLDFMKLHNLAHENQQYFSEALAYAVYLIEDKFNQELERSDARGREDFAARLYHLSREINFDCIKNEDLRRRVALISTGNIRGLDPKDIIGNEYRKDTIPTIFSVDNNYVAYLATTIQSIIENASADKSYLIIILDCGIDCNFIPKLEKQIKDFPHFQMRIISVRHFIKRHETHFVGKGHFTAAIYGRFFIPEICSHFKRAIYADVDMVFNRDIAELAEIDLSNHYIAAVIDSKMECERRVDNQWWKNYLEQKLMLNEGNAYVNSGLIVFNIDLWKKLDLSERCIEKLQESKQYIFPDQDVINAVCKDKIYYLGQKWNCICHAKSEIDNELISDAINKSNFLEQLVDEYHAAYYGDDTVFHYTSAVKPWSHPKIENGDKWWNYCRRTIYYEDILLAGASRSQIGSPEVALPSPVEKFSLFGIPIMQKKINQYCKRFWVFGIRWFKILRANNVKSFYFLWFKFMTRKHD